METNQAEEGREGYRDRNKGEKDMHIQQGFLEEVVRGEKCTHPKWYFRGLTKSNLTGV